MQELVRAVREIRNQYMVDDRKALDVFVRCTESVAADFRALAPFIQQLAGVGALTCGPDTAKPPQASSKVHNEFSLYVSLAGLIDIAKEKARIEKQLAEKRKHLQSGQAKLANESFVSSAPPDVVQKQRETVAETEKQIAALEENLRDLG